MSMPGGIMIKDRSHESSLERVEAALEALVRSVSEDGSCGGRWTHEITPVVKNCGVVRCGHRPVLQVNPVWLRELAARHELEILVDEMRTWCAIQNEVARWSRRARHRHDRPQHAA